MNNKGFAITTVIYGLSIMGILLMAILMGTLSSNRSNNNQFARSVEEELTRFNKTDTSFKPKVSGNNPVAQKFVVPEGESGWYRIELWGSQGKTISGSHEKEEEKVKNAYGAYTSGIIELKEGDELFFFVGKNRGANSNGAATEVRIKDGDYTDEISYSTRIMVAAGGGKNEGASGGTLYGYNKCMNSINGYIDTNTINKTYRLLGTGGTNPTNGTLVGYPNNYNSPASNETASIVQCGTIKSQPQIGVGSSVGQNGGGDGYYPGTNENVGGVSYISGYAGSKAIIKGKQENTPTYQYYELKYNEANDEYYYNDGGDHPKYYFLDGRMYAGVNNGNGRAKIERLVEKKDESQTLPRQNTNLDNVRYIKDCLGIIQPTGVSITWKKLIAMHEGTPLTPPNVGTTTEPIRGVKCNKYDLGGIYNLDEIAVWHNDGVDFNDHIMEVSKDGTNYVTIKGKATTDGATSSILNKFPSETESVTGIRVSAYQIDSTATLPPTGNYYIVPVLAENKVLTAPNSEASKNSITLEPFNGYKRQIWSIEEINNPNISPAGSGEYKIVELARYKALAITHDENMMENIVSAQEKFNNNARNEPQIWKIRPMGNGTYTISTVMPVYDTDNPSGYLVPQTNADASDEYNQIVIGKDYNSSPPITTERFKLIALEYN